MLNRSGSALLAALLALLGTFVARPIEITIGERVARSIVWIGFAVASAVGFRLAKA